MIVDFDRIGELLRFECGEEKCLVLAVINLGDYNGAALDQSEFIAAALWGQRTVELPRGIGRVAVVPIRVATELIRTGFRNGIDDSTSAYSILSGVAGGNYLKFLYRIRGESNSGPADPYRRCVSAVGENRRTSRAAAADAQPRAGRRHVLEDSAFIRAGLAAHPRQHQR